MNLTNLFEGAIDDLEQRRIEDLEAKMDDLAQRAKESTDPKHIAALRHEFAKAKAERDSYHYVREWEDSAPGEDAQQTSLEPVDEEWSQKYKDSINCSNPKGFSQKAHCAGKNKTDEAANPAQQAAIAINMKKHHQKPKVDEHGGGGDTPRQWHAYVRAHRADEGYQDFNKVEPYAVCLAGKPVKKFDYYEQARRFHDNWKQKLYREGDKAKADKITLMPLNMDEASMASAEHHPTGPEFTGYWKGTDSATPGNKMVGGAAESKEFKVPAARNFVAKNMKSAGSGQHKDMKRAMKQGDVKHKAQRIPDMEEGAKVDRMQQHIAQSEKALGHSKKDAESIAWATLNKRGYLDNANKKKHNESVNFMEWAVAQGSRFANFANNPETYAEAKAAYLAEGFGTALANVSSKISGHPRKMKSAQQIRNKAMKFAPQPIAEDELDEMFGPELQAMGGIGGLLKDYGVPLFAFAAVAAAYGISQAVKALENGESRFEQLVHRAVKAVDKHVIHDMANRLHNTYSSSAAVAECSDEEYNDEGGMAKNQIHTIKRNAEELEHILSADENLPEWIQLKLTLAQDYIQTAADYMQSAHERDHEIAVGQDPINEIKKGQKDSNGYTKCWPGHHAQGTKPGKNGGRVRNCVPNESIEEALRDPWNEKYFGPGEVVQKVFKVKADNGKSYNIKAATEQQAKETFQKHAPGANIVSIKFDSNVMNEDGDRVDPIIIKALERIRPGIPGNGGPGSELYTAAKEALAIEFGLLQARNNSTFVNYLNQLQDLYRKQQGVKEDWQKVNKKDKTDGMSKKAVNAYRREHPGSKLKTAVTTKPSKLKKGSKASKRRKSYCSRSKGQMKMHNISCAKTPDKAICKARRRWNCEGVERLDAMLAEAIEKNSELQPGQYYIWTVYFDDGSSKRIKVTKDTFDPKAYYAKKNQVVVNVDYDWAVHNA